MSERSGPSESRRESLLRVFALFAVLLGIDLVVTAWLYQASVGQGPAFLVGLIVTLFFLLNALLLFGCLHAGLGAIMWLLGKSERPVFDDPLEQKYVVIMPIYMEDAVKVGARMEAIGRSVEAAGELGAFHFYLLSDSTSDEQWIMEEAMWRHLCQRTETEGRLFYRRRRKNVNRKSGNVADFVEQYGGDYESMLVLDADSLMDGDSIVRMAREMEANPQVGILQSPPRFVRSETPFARICQWALRLYGPLSSRGLDAWQGTCGSYWGHNAFIRIAPFAECCELPDLPGKEPFGGKILSHDFVEAALMVRAGWQVKLAWDVEGSYEEFPPSLYDFLIRDRRWCQGNLQHVWILFAKNFPLSVRLHLLVGVFSYLSGPLWLAFLAAGALMALFGASVDGEILLYVSVVLFLPKVLGLVRLMVLTSEREAFGGFWRTLWSAAWETVFSALIAPVVMIGHSLIVLDLLRGRVVSWGAQNRVGQGTSWREAFKAHWVAMVVGVIFTVISLRVGPVFFAWMAPILLGLLGSVILSVWSSRPSVGRWLKHLRLFSSPDERGQPKVVMHADHAEEGLRTALDREFKPHPDVLTAVLVDPVLNIHHRRLLPEDKSVPEAWIDRVLLGGVKALSRQEMQDLLYNRQGLRAFHTQVWEEGTMGLHGSLKGAVETCVNKAA